MSTNYLERLYAANAIAEKAYLDNLKSRILKNQKYIDLFTDLVLFLIENFDYNTCEFNTNNISEKFYKIVGKPRNIFSSLSKESKTAEITFRYNEDYTNKYKDIIELPNIYNEYVDDGKDKIDLFAINSALNEYGIKVKTGLYDDTFHAYGTDSIYVIFDASLLVDTYNKLHDETNNTKNNRLY